MPVENTLLAVLRWGVIRGAIRSLIFLVLTCALTVMAAPRKPFALETVKTDCCALTAAAAASSHECEHQLPKPDPDQDCCASCPFGLAILATANTPFVYPPTGNETFAAYISSGQVLPHRPPVPPPRA